MKTITQLRDEVKQLMKASADIDAKATLENRGLNESEKNIKTELLDKVEEMEREISVREREERIAARLNAPGEAATVPKTTERVDANRDTRTKDKFKNLGEQLAAVVNAARPGGSTDPRLYNAASGLNEAVSSEGGFLVQQDFSNEMLQEVFSTGVLASRCRRQPISGNANGIKINGVDETSRASTRNGGILGYWEDEADTKTASKPKFRKIELSLKKLIGLCYATDELLMDAAGLESFIRQAFVGEFGFLLDDAIINGSGAGQPLGILNAGSLVPVEKETGQGAATIQLENIINMYARRFASQTQNYAWFYNQDIEPQLNKLSLTVGTGGVPAYMPPGGLSDAPYGRLMGLPAIAIEQCATIGTVGDIILANLKNGYILAEKGGIQADMSIHVAFLTDQSVFRFVLRVDGQPVRATALTPYKGSNTLSHFIALETRS